MASKERSIAGPFPWEGLHGLRYTGIGRVDIRDDTTLETNYYLVPRGYEPKLLTETNDQWHRRTNGGRGKGAVALANSIELPDQQEGGENG